MPKGGARPGAGRKVHGHNKSTLEIRKMIDQVSKFRGRGLQKVLEALFEKAEGVVISELRTDGGRVIFKEPPDVAAARVILEFRFGKAKEALDVTSGEKEIIGIGLAVPARRTPLKTDETQ